jgi:hypothetical protein
LIIFGQRTWSFFHLNVEILAEATRLQIFSSVQDKTLWRRFFDAILEVERALAAHG